MKHQSQYDPSRQTVGAIYRNAQMESHEPFVTSGDLAHDLTRSLVDDLNDTIKQGTIDFGGDPFYILVYEKKDLQMKRAIVRRLYKVKYRPYPEQDTVVFYVKPATNEVCFCWCLPHKHEIDNMIANAWLYDPKEIKLLEQWKMLDLWHYGFCKDDMGNWMANPNWKDQPLKPQETTVSRLIL